jgi:hypothetical protein
MNTPDATQVDEMDGELADASGNGGSGGGVGADGFANASGQEVVTADERTVSYVFPVEVIVVGLLTEEHYRALEARVWANFGEAFAQSV